VHGGRVRTAEKALCATVICGVALVAMASPGGTEPWDPIPVFFPTSYCGTGIFEVERWSRTRATWEPHPDHPRIAANSCQIEDAGWLYNETRFRCFRGPNEARVHPWRRIQVFNPQWMRRCPVPTGPPDPGLFAVRLESPQPGDVVANLTRTVEVHGWVEAANRPVSGHDLIFVLDAAPGARDAGRDLAVSLIRTLRDRPEAIRAGVVRFSSAARAGGGRASDANHVLLLDDDLERVAQSLMAAPPHSLRGDGGALEALDRVLAVVEAREPASPTSLPTQVHVVFTVDASAPHPFGRIVGLEPQYRARLLEVAREARSYHVVLHVIALAGPSREMPELARQLRFEVLGAFVWSTGAETGVGLARQLAEQILPEVSSMVVRNLDNDTNATDLQLEPFGRFHANLPLRDGRNRIAVRALLSANRRAEGEFEIFFDPSGPKEEWMRAERERIERNRNHRRRKQLIIEKED
jgi:hypothetical protein